MRKILLGICLLSVAGFAAYWHSRSKKPVLPVAYAGDKKITLWSTTAQVREPVATVDFGDRLEVLNHAGDYAEVRGTKGATGWVEERQLMSSDLWDQAEAMLSKSREMPIEAVGHTKVVTNMHVTPGRNAARIRQFPGGVPLDVFERRVVDIPESAATAERKDGNSGSGDAPKREDWWFVRAHPEGQDPVAGWVIGRFIDLDLPAPLPDYTSAADMRPVAWFVLNEVADPSGEKKPQYLVLGSHGPEGQPCDFTMIRGYTWSIKHQQYETAYVESDLCGYLPVTLNSPAQPGGDVLFHFQDTSEQGNSVREYRMRQTIIRRIDTGELAVHRPHAR